VNLTEDKDIKITSPKPYSSSLSSDGSIHSCAESDLLSARDSIDRELEARTVVEQVQEGGAGLRG